ncbi:hypothetical protein DAETH_12110 [Deinococcus aetherius]|uniref:AB hydrolase-1 domain-containing protein n=1 Tax=Deinococcus aetherius TaxID=200252 RepID=A0ABM8ABW3_9DEIO|nr:hypothetical protein DAETH_12110 [Deinococcus aetherius]
MEHAGRPLQVTELGTNEPALVLLSGLGDPASWWFSVPSPEEAGPHWQGDPRGDRPGLAPGLASVARVVAYDRAGVGGSAALDHDRTWDEIYAELEAVLNALHLTRPPVLVGHSLGGMIASTYARRHLSRVGGLVLLDMTPPPLEPRPHGPSPERLALTHFEPPEVAPHVLGDLPLVLVAPGRPSTVAEVAWQQPTATREALDSRFRQRRERHEQILRTSARSRAVWTSQPGHYVHLDTPDVVMEAVLEVWQEVRARLE